MEVTDMIRRLKTARQQAGLSQAQVAQLMEVERTTVTNWESPSSSQALTVHTLLRLSEIYGVSPVWVFTGVNPNFDKQSFMDAYYRVAGDVRRIADTLEMLPTQGDTDNP